MDAPPPARADNKPTPKPARIAAAAPNRRRRYDRRRWRREKAGHKRCTSDGPQGVFYPSNRRKNIARRGHRTFARTRGSAADRASRRASQIVPQSLAEPRAPWSLQFSKIGMIFESKF